MSAKASDRKGYELSEASEMSLLVLIAISHVQRWCCVWVARHANALMHSIFNQFENGRK